MNLPSITEIPTALQALYKFYALLRIPDAIPQSLCNNRERREHPLFSKNDGNNLCNQTSEDGEEVFYGMIKIEAINDTNSFHAYLKNKKPRRVRRGAFGPLA